MTSNPFAATVTSLIMLGAVLFQTITTGFVWWQWYLAAGALYSAMLVLDDDDLSLGFFLAMTVMWLPWMLFYVLNEARLRLTAGPGK